MNFDPPGVDGAVPGIFGLKSFDCGAEGLKLGCPLPGEVTTGGANTLRKTLVGF